MTDRQTWTEYGMDLGAWGVGIYIQSRRGSKQVKGRWWGSFTSILGPFHFNWTSMPIEPVDRKTAFKHMGWRFTKPDKKTRKAIKKSIDLKRAGKLKTYRLR